MQTRVILSGFCVDVEQVLHQEYGRIAKAVSVSPEILDALGEKEPLNGKISVQWKVMPHNNSYPDEHVKITVKTSYS